MNHKMKLHLSRIRSPWRRRLITWLLVGLHRSERFARRRARIHWVGNAHRPRRLERVLFLVLVPVAALVFEPQQYLWWAVGWGGFFALAINLYLILQLMPASIVNRKP